MAVVNDTSTKLNDYLQTSQHRSYFLIFATVVFVIVMTVFGILPAYSAFTLQGEENGRRQEAIDKLTLKLSTLKQLTEESQRKSKTVDYFDFIFPKDPDQDLMLNEIIVMADGANVFLKDLNFKKNEELRREFEGLNVQVNNHIKSLTIALTLEGSQQTLNNFIKELEVKRRIYNVKNFNITRKSEQDIALTTPDKYYNMVMNMSIYYFDESQLQVNN